MSSVSEIILKYVFPSLGIVTGTFMAFAPYRAVLKASRNGRLGDLNPTPWIFMLGNCCGWLAYSFLTDNWFIYLSNAPGFILAIWLNIQAIKIKYETHRSQDLRENIIAALEDKSQKMLNGREVARLFDKVAKEDRDKIVLDPSATVPLPIDEIVVDTANTSTHNSSVPASEDLGDSDSESTVEEDEQDQEKRRSSVVANMAVHSRAAANVVFEVTAQKTPAPVSHELMVVGISAFWVFLISIAALGSDFGLGKGARTLLVGLMVNLNLIFFYGAPLSTIFEVLRTKSSKTIYVPTMICSTSNGFLWFSYGMSLTSSFASL